ncbi:MAG: sodium/glutamate symporter [Lachnospiraceae bacterium]|nr:sodium/glutamate symporter [Lachnospiraceae bacterium]
MRKSRKFYYALSAVLICVLLTISACSGSSGDTEIRFGTGGTGGTYYAYGLKLAEHIDEEGSGTSVTVQSTAGSAANLRLIGSGLLDAAIVQNDVLDDAVSGTGAFAEDGAVSNIRAVAGLYTEACQVVALGSSEIETIDDLAGKKVSVGSEGSGVMVNAEQILQAYGLSFNDIEPVYLSFTEAAEAMEKGEIDAFFCTASAPTNAVSDLAENVDIKILSLDERALKQIRNSYSGFSVTAIPAGTYSGQDEEVVTIGVKAVLVADSELSESAAASLLDAVFENEEALREVTGQTAALDYDYAVGDISASFHDGAVSWYAERGVIVSGASEDSEETSGIRSVSLDMYQTIAIAVAALLVGAVLKKKIHFLEKFCVPAPVVGGLVFAIAFCILYVAGIVEFSFDETLRTVCMVIFFTSVGFQANMKVIKSGGRGLIVFLVLVLVLILLQNTVAVGLSSVLGIDPLIGLCTGSIPMIGGHGTAGAFGPLLEDMNVSGATTLATAAATFGLIVGSLMGGPMANRLIIKKDLLKTAVPADDSAIVENEEEHRRQVSMYAPAAYQIVIAMGLGTIASYLLSKTGMTFPVYIGSMIIAAIMRNISEYTGIFRVRMGEINDLGGICLALFLGIAMITLKLWQLADLALPLVVLLLGQTLLMYVFARFAVFKLMGGDYDAAVISAGTCGFGMGATPNAMANMQAVTDKFAPSVKAYLLIPIVGSMFADFLNSLTITFFVNFLG